MKILIGTQAEILFSCSGPLPATEFTAHATFTHSCFIMTGRATIVNVGSGQQVTSWSDFAPQLRYIELEPLQSYQIRSKGSAIIYSMYPVVTEGNTAPIPEWSQGALLASEVLYSGFDSPSAGVNPPQGIVLQDDTFGIPTGFYQTSPTVILGNMGIRDALPFPGAPMQRANTNDFNNPALAGLGNEFFGSYLTARSSSAVTPLNHIARVVLAPTSSWPSQVAFIAGLVDTTGFIVYAAAPGPYIGATTQATLGTLAANALKRAIICSCECPPDNGTGSCLLYLRFSAQIPHLFDGAPASWRAFMGVYAVNGSNTPSVIFGTSEVIGTVFSRSSYSQPNYS